MGGEIKVPVVGHFGAIDPRQVKEKTPAYVPNGINQVEHDFPDYNMPRPIAQDTFPTSVQSFYYWLIKNGTGKQRDYFKFAIGRMAREHPDKDPRCVILEWLAEQLTCYEQYQKQLRAK